MPSLIGLPTMTFSVTPFRSSTSPWIAAFEVTVNHLLDAAIHGEVDDLDGVTENVIVGKPIKLGTGDVDLKMGSFNRQSEQAD